jgi:GNAT superfamily N-acetyltransferase
MSRPAESEHRDALPLDALVIEPLTSRHWPAFAELMEEGGPSRRCWCMYWRIGAEYRTRAPDDNRDALHEAVAAGPPLGLVALAGSTAVGWCQVTAREALPALDRPWRLRRVDDVPVWCISCFYVRKGWRRRGVMTRLTEAAVDFARRGGAPAVEVYPLDAEVSPSATSMGYASTFQELGFSEIARRSPERPIMRLELT